MKKNLSECQQRAKLKGVSVRVVASLAVYILLFQMAPLGGFVSKGIKIHLLAPLKLSAGLFLGQSQWLYRVCNGGCKTTLSTCFHC